MKTKVNDIGMIKQSLGWLAVFAGAGLAVGALNYRELSKDIELGEKKAELNQIMMEVAHENALLHQLGAGQVDEARKQLSYKLAHDLAELNVTSASAEAGEQELARAEIVQVSHEKSKHPEYYLAAAGLEKIQTGEVAQITGLKPETR